MPKSTELLTVAVVAVAAFYILKTFKPTPLNTQQAATAIQNAGGSTYNTSLGTFYQVPGGVIKLSDQPQAWNLAQRMLVGVDKIIPGNWLTRAVLT